MAVSKSFIIVLVILSLLFLHQAATAPISPHQLKGDATPNDVGGEKIDCGAACVARCQLSSRPNLCNRACGTCCNRCNCVPPGTSGNYDACLCYGNMKTHDNQRKCP